MIQVAFETIVNAVEMLIAIGFLTVFLGCRFKGTASFVSFVAGWICAFGVLSFMNSITRFESLGTYIYIAVYFLYAVVCLKGTILRKLWMSVIAQIIITMLAVITIVATACIFGCSPDTIISKFGHARVFAVVLSKIVLLLIYGVILNHRDKDIRENAMWYKLIFIPFISVISVTSMMKVCIQHPNTKYMVLLGMLSLGFANIMVYYFYTVISNEYNNRFKLFAANELIKRQEAQYDLLFSGNEEIRKQRHDYKNFVLGILGMLSKNDLQNIDAVKDRLKSELKTLENSSISAICGDSVIDTIINYKKDVAREQRIEIDVEYRNVHGLDISGVDMSILLGNALDNATEATEKVCDRERKISVSLISKTNQFIISVSNPTCENKDVNNLKTDKDNSHGYGLVNMRKIAEKYNGEIVLSCENEVFTTIIILRNGGKENEKA